MISTFYLVGIFLGLCMGLVLGILGTAFVVWKFFPRRIEHVVIVPAEAIARGIVQAGGIAVTPPPMAVDWSFIHQVIEREGYQLISKHAPGPVVRQ